MPMVLTLLGFLWLIRRFVTFRIVVMEPRFFGHLALEPEVFVNEFKLVETSPRQVQLCTFGKISHAANVELWRLRRKSTPSIPSWIVSEINYWQRVSGKSVIRIDPASYHKLNFLKSTPPTLPVESHFDQRRKEILQRFAQPDRPYVIFSVREASSIEDLRNRQIAEFETAMTGLVDVGFNVIRLTSQTEDRLSLTHPNILDFQVRVDGRPLDELALVSKTSFVVSSTTGIDCLALAYRRPVLYIDAARFFYMFLGTELATIQMPRFISLVSGEPITLNDLVAMGLAWEKDSSAFRAKGVQVMNSSAAEIKDCVSQYAQTFSRVVPTDSSWLQNLWRSQLMARHSSEVMARHGDVKATFSEWYLLSHGHQFVTGSTC
jgi:putative glycosyltransferase (TIGR04372 family)